MAGDSAALADAGALAGAGAGAGGACGAAGGRAAGEDVIARVLGKARSLGPGGLVTPQSGAGGGMIGAHMGAVDGGASASGGESVAGGQADGLMAARTASAPLSPGAAGLGAVGEPSSWGVGGAGDMDAGAGAGAVPSVMRRNSGYYAYEERPAVARGALARGSETGPTFGGGGEAGLVDADPSGVSAAAMFRGSGGAGGAAVEAPAPAGWSKELPVPEPVAGAAAKEAEVVAELAGDYVAAAFFSRNWQLRDAGIAWVTDLVRNGKVRGGPSGGRMGGLAAACRVC